MQYGVITYTRTANMGDDIQAYAASRFYPHVDYYIDREKIDTFFSENSEKVAAIMAGWYMHSPLNWPPSPFIKPLMVSMHFSPSMELACGTIKKNALDDTASMDWFEQSGDRGVGCRDEDTARMLEKLGVRTWWSGCITLTLNRYSDVEKHDKIVCVDVENNQVDVIRRHTTKEVVSMTHRYTQCISVEERMKTVEDRLKFYQGASLLITTRLHALLPAIALGVPVIYVINEKTDACRFNSYLKYVDCIDKEDLLKGNIPYDFDNMAARHTMLNDMGEALSDYCKKFVCDCENIIDVPKLDIDMFIDSVKRTERLKQLIYKGINDKELIAWSQQTEDYCVLSRYGAEAMEHQNWDKAIYYLGLAFDECHGADIKVEMNIFMNYIRALVKSGDLENAKYLLDVGKEAYYKYEEFHELYQEVLKSNM